MLTLSIPLLRLADNLDRSHDQRIQSLECRLRDGEVVLQVHSKRRHGSGAVGRRARRRSLPGGLQPDRFRDQGKGLKFDPSQPRAARHSGMAFATSWRVAHQLTGWSQLIPDAEWEVYEGVIDDAIAQGIPFALGGAFAVATYTGYWRNTKDIDLYVLPEYRDRMIEILNARGFSDLFDSKPYDRWWIYRGIEGRFDRRCDLGDGEPPAADRRTLDVRSGSGDPRPKTARPFPRRHALGQALHHAAGALRLAGRHESAVLRGRGDRLGVPSLPDRRRYPVDGRRAFGLPLAVARPRCRAAVVALGTGWADPPAADPAGEIVSAGSNCWTAVPGTDPTVRSCSLRLRNRKRC